MGAYCKNVEIYPFYPPKNRPEWIGLFWLRVPVGSPQKAILVIINVPVTARLHCVSKPVDLQPTIAVNRQ
jgi:hypothetical protein